MEIFLQYVSKGSNTLEYSFQPNFNHLNPTSNENVILKVLTTCRKIYIVTIGDLDCSLLYFTYNMILFSKLVYKRDTIENNTESGVNQYY